LNQQINSIIPYEGNDPKFVYKLLIHNAGVICGLGIGRGSATRMVNKSIFCQDKPS
jgi:hypothetical protein